MRPLRNIATTLATWATLVATVSAADVLISLDVNGKQLVGKPISWDNSRFYLLSRDGELFDFDPADAENFRKRSNYFYSYSPSEMRASLSREFGNRFDVTGTGHYLVVHPAGERDLWAQRFEELYRSFVHYFSSRGFSARSPDFPLVAVVFHQKQDFLRFASKDGVRGANGLLGYYSPRSNRVYLYDITAGKRQSEQWYANSETIIHEATHQTAFNTGVHNRFATTPRWVAEGLGTMFEAPGVWNSRKYRSRSDRINHGRLKSFRRLAESRRPRNSIQQIIAGDVLFQKDSQLAYAESWALSFYLAELQPHKYSQYLQRVAAKKPFTKYTSARREKDFTDVFGSDFHMLDVRVKRFIDELPQ